MMTLQLFSTKLENLPASTAWYLADLSEARGKQELFTRQAPQRLKGLREHALIAAFSVICKKPEKSSAWGAAPAPPERRRGNMLNKEVKKRVLRFSEYR